MADGVTVTVVGVSDAIGDLRAWQRRVHRGIEAVVIEYTLLIEAEAKRLAPVDTGRLRASIHHEIRSTAAAIVAAIISGTDYSVHQEFGTRYQSGTPHLRPAFEKYRDSFVRAVIRIIKSA